MEEEIMTAEEFNQSTGGTPPSGEESQETGDTSSPGEEEQETGGTAEAEELAGEAGNTAPSEGTVSAAETLEIIQQSLDQANFGLEQLHADVSLTFLAVVLLIGVVLGCGVSFMLSKIWRT